MCVVRLLASVAIAAAALSACGRDDGPASLSLSNVVTYKNVTFEVPNSWHVEQTTPNDQGCNSGKDVVIVGNAGSGGFCGPVTDSNSIRNIRVRDIRQVPADESTHISTTSTKVNGIPAHQSGDTSAQQTIELTRDGVEISFYGNFGTLRDTIVKSIKETK